MPSFPTRPSRGSARPIDGRILVLNAALAGLAASIVPMTICMAVSLVGWFAADTGTHGTVLDAIRVGALAWAMGLGGGADSMIGHLGMPPLGLTMIALVGVIRASRWGWRRSGIPNGAPLRPEMATAGVVFVVVYLAVVVVTLCTAVSPVLSPHISSSVGWAVLLAVLGGARGVSSSSGWGRRRWQTLPQDLRLSLSTATVSVLWLLGAAALLVAISLAVSFSTAGRLYESLHLGFGDALILTLICVLALPNAVGFSLSYMAGPGFAVGTGTSVTVSSVSLGALPIFPLVAALPDPGPQPAWLSLFLYVPGTLTAVASARSELATPSTTLSQLVFRSAGSGALAGLGVTFLASISGGALGNHRMAELGPSFWPLLLTSVGSMALGGALGGAVVMMRRHLRTERNQT